MPFVQPGWYFSLTQAANLLDICDSRCGFRNVMGPNQMHQPKTLAKILLLFFAVLFAAVLIHPDVDLVDVHDVKIANARAQFQSADGQILQQAPILLVRPQLRPSAVLERLSFAEESVSSGEGAASGVLRV
jgi:hypothetical protein